MRLCVYNGKVFYPFLKARGICDEIQFSLYTIVSDIQHFWNLYMVQITCTLKPWVVFRHSNIFD